MNTPKIRTDFNGFLRSNLLCLAHCEFPKDHTGNAVVLREGMHAIAYEEDMSEDGQPEFLVFSGIVERSPDIATHLGSVWSLMIDSRGV